METLDGSGPETAAAPVIDTGRSAPEDGIAIALSGGGYRAMLFHLGTLWRLYETDLLRDVRRISSVSGGSITAGRLAVAWPDLQWGDGGASFVELVVNPVRALASRSIDIPAVGLGLLLNNRPGLLIEWAYRRYLFGKRTLQDLPDTPRFVINATNLGNGVLWRFSKPYMGDWRSGRYADPDVSLARAVAASSAFPPFLSPIDVRIDPGAWIPTPHTARPAHRKAILTDGGVYDNLGLETVWKRYRTLFVSDGGAALTVQQHPSRRWPLQGYRALSIIQNQVGALRSRLLVSSFRSANAQFGRNGSIFPIGADPSNEAFAPSLPCPVNRARELAGTPTALRRLSANYQERLINWGYAICDARIRRHYLPALPAPAGFPYRDTGI